MCFCVSLKHYFCNSASCINWHFFFFNSCRLMFCHRPQLGPLIVTKEEPLDMLKYHHYLMDCRCFKVPRCVSPPLLSLMATDSPDWMNSTTPKGSSFLRTVMLTSLWSPRRLGGVLWLLNTTEKVSSSCAHKPSTHKQMAANAQIVFVQQKQLVIFFNWAHQRTCDVAWKK